MKDNDLLIRAIFLVVSVLLVSGIVILIFSFQTGQQDEKTTVGAVLIGESGDNGWNESHYSGIKEACDTYHCEMNSRMNVPEEEGALKQAVSELIKQGCNCIFLTSYGYGAYLDSFTERLIFPKTIG